MEITITPDYLYSLWRSQHRRAANKGLVTFDEWEKLITSNILKNYDFKPGTFILDFLKKLDLNQKVKVEKELLRIELITFK